ncbi:MAG TPA: T9SS type A sorting domain-containing protein [Candidatus Cloacimonadota bacterium]|nr:T9SS type A sorting domain-containing protein [Candidatus Cloacimonadota bacterium]
MRQALLCTVMLVLAGMAWSQPMWTDEATVRAGQDLNYFGNPILAVSNRLLNVWVETNGNMRTIYADLIVPGGESLWTSPIVIKSSEASIASIETTFTIDNYYIISWLEADAMFNHRIMMQKIDLTGDIIWGNGVCVASDRLQGTYTYRIAANTEYGAYVFYKESRANTMYGLSFNSSGVETWGLMAPTITTPANIILSDLVSGSSFGAILHYKCTSTQTNYLEMYSYGGVMIWQRSYPFAPGESNYSQHDIQLDNYRIYDIVKCTGSQQSLSIRSFSRSGTPLIDPPLELVVAETTAPDFAYSSTTNNQKLLFAFQKSIGTGNEICLYTINYSDSVATPPGGLLVGTSNADVRDLIIDCNPSFTFVTWIEDADNSETLKVNRIGPEQQLPYGTEGMTVYSGNSRIWNYGMTVSSYWMNTTFLVTENNEKKLKLQSISDSGTISYPAGGLTQTSVKTGFSSPHAIYRSGENAIVLFSDCVTNGSAEICYQMIDPSGEPVLADAQTLSPPSGSAIYVNSCEYPDGVAVVYDSDGVYFRSFSAAEGVIDPAILISANDTYSASLSYYNGDFYLGWMQRVGAISQLMGQRIHNGEKCWGTGGKVLIDNIPNSSSFTNTMKGRYFTWLAYDPLTNTTSVYCLLVDINGDPYPGWNANGEIVFSPPTDHEIMPFYAQLDDENLILVMGGYSPASIYARKITTEHTYPWGTNAVQIADQSATYAYCVPTNRGLGIVMDDRQADSRFIRYQHLDNSGNLQYDDQGVIIGSTTPVYDDLQRLSLCDYDNGGMLAIWSIGGENQPEKIFYRTIGSAGDPIESEPQIISVDNDRQRLPISLSMDNEAIVVWQSYRSDDYFYDDPFIGLKAQKINGMNASHSHDPEQIEPPLAINSAYPNPFSGSITMEWRQKYDDPVEISIYNLKGQLVKRYPSNRAGKGDHSLIWKGDDSQGKQVATGIYFIRVESGRSVQTRKLVKL